MALWLACDLYGEEKPKCLKLEDVKPSEAHETVKWKGAHGNSVAWVGVLAIPE